MKKVEDRSVIGMDLTIFPLEALKKFSVIKTWRESIQLSGEMAGKLGNTGITLPAKVWMPANMGKQSAPIGQAKTSCIMSLMLFLMKTQTDSEKTIWPGILRQFAKYA